MSPADLPSLQRRDVALAVLAVGLLAAPLWSGPLHLGDPTYELDRVEVTTDGSGLGFADEREVRSHVAVSDEIGCSSEWDVRVCSFERLLVENRTVPTEMYTSNPNHTSPGFLDERYQYVLVDDAVYEPRYVPNRSVRNGDTYRVDLGLERVSPDRALEVVSLPVDAREVPRSVAAAARNGEAVARQEVEIPETPIRLEDGTYYRVHLAGGDTGGPRPLEDLDFALRYVAPLVGLYAASRLFRRHFGVTRRSAANAGDVEGGETPAGPDGE